MEKPKSDQGRREESGGKNALSLEPRQPASPLWSGGWTGEQVGSLVRPKAGLRCKAFLWAVDLPPKPPLAPLGLTHRVTKKSAKVDSQAQVFIIRA